MTASIHSNVCNGCAPCKGGAFQWVQVPPGKRSSRKQPERAWRRRNVRSLRVKRATNWWLRECAGRNASERRASLEKVDAQADLPTLAGKADTAGGNERGSTARGCAGVVATACTQGKRAQHGKPRGVVSDGQPDAGDGQAGRRGVAERLGVPTKPGNAGGGKGPQFKTDARRGEGRGDWAT